MVPVADYPRLAFGAAAVCIVLVLLWFIVSVLSLVPGEGKGAVLFAIAPVVAMLLLMLGGFLALVGMVLYIYEIATSKNDGQWKAIWIIVVLILGLIGIVAYEIVARKQRQVKL